MSSKRRNPARNTVFTAQSTLSLLVAVATAKPGPARPSVAAAKGQRDATARISGEGRHHMIALAAHGRAERAGFRSDPVSDWLVAEREVDALLERRAS
jgi:hypothetical protein